jgi:hypothetical protein
MGKWSYYVIAGILFFYACTSGNNKHTIENKKEVSTATKQEKDSDASMNQQKIDSLPQHNFKLSESMAENLVIKQKLVRYELEYQYKDTSLHNALMLVSNPTADEPFYYFDILKMLPSRGEAIENFRVDVNSGQITVRDRDIINSDAWVSPMKIKKRRFE